MRGPLDFLAKSNGMEIKVTPQERWAMEVDRLRQEIRAMRGGR